MLSRVKLEACIQSQIYEDQTLLAVGNKGANNLMEEIKSPEQDREMQVVHDLLCKTQNLISTVKIE